MIYRTILTVFCLSISLYTFSQTTATKIKLDSLKKIKDPTLLAQRLKMLGDGTEGDLNLLVQYYSKSRKAVDSVVQLAISKYPKGDIAFAVQAAAIDKASTASEKEQVFMGVKVSFPNKDPQRYTLNLANAYAAEKNTTKALFYLAQLGAEYRIAGVQTLATTMMAYDLTIAENLLNAELSKPDLTARAQFGLLNVYSKLMTKKGDYVMAFEAVKKMYDLGISKSTSLRDNYHFLMSKAGHYAQALPELEKVVRSGFASNELKSELLVAYGKLNPGKDQKLYLASLMNSLGEDATAKATKLMINEPAPNFVVTDVNGKRVSLSDFKGKILVLDFWATWCTPCKASLPAMQKLVNKYQKDSDVAFLFIHTWERDAASALQEAKQYFADKGYKMPLYMDMKDAKTLKNEAISAFKVKGIPAKFVIDGKGSIRFKSTGFSGADDIAVAELSAMIELSR